MLPPMRLLALAARGTLELVAAECKTLGLTVVQVSGEGVALEAGPRDIAKALVYLRIATRVLLYLDEFVAHDAGALYEGAAAIDWPTYLDTRSTFSVHASGDLVPSEPGTGGRPGRRGLDTHVFVAMRIKDAIADRLRGALGARPDVSLDDPIVRVVARGHGGRWGVYLDLCDPPLFQRGYRVDQGPAPLKETLAAAVAELAGWGSPSSTPGQDGGRLHDPMCGSGTLIAEAVGRALKLAPGCTRWFAVERWPNHGEQMRKYLADIRAGAIANARRALADARLDVVASDLDPRALAATKANLAAAGIGHLVRVELADATTMPPPPPGTTLLCNPPYGERLGGKGVVDLYRALGQHWGGFRGCTAHIIDGNPAFAGAFGLTPTATHRLWSGPLEIALRRYRLGVATGKRVRESPVPGTDPGMGEDPDSGSNGHGQRD